MHNRREVWRPLNNCGQSVQLCICTPACCCCVAVVEGLLGVQVESLEIKFCNEG